MMGVDIKKVEKNGALVLEVWKNNLLVQTVPHVITFSESFGIYAGTYQYYKHGNYNFVHRSDNRWVLKIPIDPSGKTDLPERAVRLWNIINPGPEHCAQMIRRKEVPIAWVAPFIQGAEPTQKEIAQKILEIYEKTRRIVVDAFVTSNFIKTPDGSIVCVDVGNAFFLERRPEFKKIHSQVSLDTWHGDEGTKFAMINAYRNAFYKSKHPVIVQVTKALLYLQEHRPEFQSVSAMLNNDSLITLLARGYDLSSRDWDWVAKRLTQEHIPAKLDEYIASIQFAERAPSASPSFPPPPSPVSFFGADDDRFLEEAVSPSADNDQDRNGRATNFENILTHQAAPAALSRQRLPSLPAFFRPGEMDPEQLRIPMQPLQEVDDDAVFAAFT